VSDALHMHYIVDGSDFTTAGEASTAVKMKLKKLGIAPDIVRKVAIAMYEAEINMVIHAGGGVADVSLESDKITIRLIDHGKGIPDVDLAMREGYSTAPDAVRSLGFGAGMGLPNIKKYSDEMYIDTEVGKGTTVTLIINLQ
jgi:serine/threonine-protein kinase RsbT